MRTKWAIKWRTVHPYLSGYQFHLEWSLSMNWSTNDYRKEESISHHKVKEMRRKDNEQVAIQRFQLTNFTWNGACQGIGVQMATKRKNQFLITKWKKWAKANSSLSKDFSWPISLGMDPVKELTSNRLIEGSIITVMKKWAIKRTASSKTSDDQFHLELFLSINWTAKGW